MERIERKAIKISGAVQGVGFRPAVHRWACELGLSGFVQNESGGVAIEIQGAVTVVDRFLAEFADRLPPLAQIEDMACSACPPQDDAAGFQIRESRADRDGRIRITPDLATCPECLAELHDPDDRRYGYVFSNCTHCGPRLTIVTGAPYDRERTTMVDFAMCAACRAEYEDPRDRRFHAQAIACPDCGPQLQLVAPDGKAIDSRDPVDQFARALLAGQIGALKGLGGYHLACDARNTDAVAELRRRKHRDEKPFAIMVRDRAVAGRLCDLNKRELSLLESRERPIVLLRKRAEDSSVVCDAVAPGNPYLGVMLPYTPLHHLLVERVEGIPLVMTSGNLSDAPIAHRDEDALAQLGGVADLFLMHNRRIQVRCDDSVTRIVGGVEAPLRRSRGYAPQSIPLPLACDAPVLALGGQFKAVFALACERYAILSHHLGDLDHLQAYEAFERDVALYEELFAVSPQWVVHDLHPDYASTHYALKRSREHGVRLLPVQHHHAHVASCMAEHGLCEPVIGVAFDGAGYGVEAESHQPTVWGGEFLVGDYAEVCRAAHLRNVGLPGGDKAAREPWRMAAAHLLDAGCGLDLLAPRIADGELRTIESMIDRRVNTPLTSSAGRLFDAVSAILGLRDRISYEGQAAMQLEWLAEQCMTDGEVSYPFEIGGAEKTSPHAVDTRPLIRAVVDDIRHGVSPATIARRFHITLAEIITAVCRLLRHETGLDTVVLSGGVFCNALLTREATDRLTEDGFRVCTHRIVPPNDGGLALGQIAVAAALLAGAPVSETI